VQYLQPKFFSPTLAALKMPTSTDTERFIAALANARHVVDMKVAEIIKEALEEHDKQAKEAAK
jgi:hypothetical protein